MARSIDRWSTGGGWRRTSALLAALALAAVACGGDDGGEPGTGGTDGTGTGSEAGGDPIVVGAVFDLSGATADVGTPFADGVKAYVEWLNANGGVEGRPIELLNQDYAYDVPTAEQLYTQFTSQGAVAFSGWGTGDTEALVPKVTQDEIPFVSASYSEQLSNPEEAPYNFIVAQTYSDQMRVALNHIAEQAGDEHVEIAVFHHDSPFGLSPVEDGQAYIDEQGYDFGYQAYPMPGGATNYFGELTQAQNQGAQYIIVQNVSSPAAQLARDIQGQGIDAQLVCLNWCADELFVDLAGDASNGTIGVIPWAPPSQADGDLSDVESYLEENGQTLDDINLHFTQGWYQFSVLVQGIQKVVADGGEVTGAAIKEALETLDYDTPVSVPITFGPDDHEGMDSGRVYAVEDGQWAAITDAITP